MIPHGFDPNLKTRGQELAKGLSSLAGVRVYYIQFASNQKAPNLGARIQFLLKEMFRPIRTSSESSDPYVRVEIPYIYLSYRRIWTWWIRIFGSWQVRRVIRRLSPDIVINASYIAVGLKKSPKYHYVYDLIDDHLPGTHKDWLGEKIGRFVISQLRESDTIWTISHALAEKLRLIGFKNVLYVPNGAKSEDFAAISSKQVHALRSELRIEGKRVLGFIGNHAKWSGLPLIKEIAEAMPDDWHFLIVGAGTEVDRLIRHPMKKLTFTGPVPFLDIAKYFCAIDIGLLPFERSPYTDNCLPIKILEYAFAKKLVVAQRLGELETLSLPFVLFPKERAVQAWVETIDEALRRSWDSDWTRQLAAYDWREIASRAFKETEHNARRIAS